MRKELKFDSEKYRRKYKVSKVAWKKFGPKGQLVYINVQESGHQTTINPMGPQIEKKYWDVIVHNFAFTAALQSKHADKFFK